MDIVTFLRARLDEDEAQARDAERIARRDYPNETGPDNTFRAWDDYPSGVVIVGPARVLREVKAKQAILSDYETAVRLTNEGHRVPTMVGTAFAVHHIVQVYADHPDYDPAWRDG